jgi:hypothetical protein
MSTDVSEEHIASEQETSVKSGGKQSLLSRWFLARLIIRP